jgi:hypothetical protein
LGATVSTDRVASLAIAVLYIPVNTEQLRIVQGLITAGYEVLGVVRSDAAAAPPRQAPTCIAVRWTASKAERPAADGVIHTAFYHDVTSGTVVRAMGHVTTEKMRLFLAPPRIPVLRKLRRPRGQRVGARVCGRLPQLFLLLADFVAKVIWKRSPNRIPSR